MGARRSVSHNYSPQSLKLSKETQKIKGNKPIQSPKLVKEYLTDIFDYGDTGKSQIQRVLPPRRCKNAATSNWSPRKRMTREPTRCGPKKQKPRKLTSFERDQLREKIEVSIIKAREAKRRPLLKIRRTVEMVNQKTEQWREEGSKLLFIEALGLTPIAIEPTPEMCLSPVVSVEIPLVKAPIKESERVQVEPKKEMSAENKLTKEEIRKARVYRLERIRQWIFTRPGIPIEDKETYE